MSNVAKVLKTIKDKEVKFVDLRFTDTKGKWQHTAQTSSTIDANTFKTFTLQYFSLLCFCLYAAYRVHATSLHSRVHCFA